MSLVGMVYVNKHVAVNMTRCTRRQPRGSSNSSSEEEVRTGRESFPQSYSFKPTSARKEIARRITMIPSLRLKRPLDPTMAWNWPIKHQELCGASAATVF